MTDESSSSRDNEEHIQILRALASGNNPNTGARLSQDSSYQSANVLRALFAAITALEKMPRKRKLPPKAGAPWTDEADARLATAFDQGMSIPDIARKFQRTNGSIGSRLEKLGKIKRYLPVEPAAAQPPPIQDERSGTKFFMPRNPFKAG